LWLLVLFYGTRGKHQTGREIAEQLLNLAERAGDPLIVAMAHWMVGWNLFFLGELAQAEAHLEHTITFYDPQQHQALASHYGLDPGVTSLSVMSWALWALGYPEQALKRSHKAIALAQELSHLPSLVLAQAYAGLLCAFRRDWQMAQELAEACIRLSTEHGFPYWLSGGLFCHGWALAEQGQAEEGIAQVIDGIAGNRTTGAEALVVLQLAALTEAYRNAGQTEEGLSSLVDALVLVNRTGERWYEAEVHRLRGELLLSQVETEVTDKTKVDASYREAERCFQRALAVARRQGAKSWELRAVMSLCRLWHSQGSRGERAEAPKLLAETYGWFSEGFDTADLRQARALLEELS
jgi:predicted ATPase